MATGNKTAEQGNLFEVEVARSLLDQLLADSRLYTKSADYQALLDFAVRMRNFAPFNAMLLQIQKPGLSFAASATDWLERFGRTPKQAARPLVILWPFGPVAFVYDVLDTEGDPLPTDVSSFFARGRIESVTILGCERLLRKKQIAWHWLDAGDTVIDHSKLEAVRVSPSESLNRVERGDLLFNGLSETPEEVALCALVQCDVHNLYLNSFCFGYRLRTDAEVDGLFLTYYIRSSEGREIMKSLAQGSTRYNLSKKALLAAEVRMPNLPEQVAIAGTLSDMDAELTALEARRDKTRALKQGMMQELLTGRTRLV